MLLKPRSPEDVLKDVEIYLSDINVPTYVATQALRKAIKQHPENTKLKEKLKEIEDKTAINDPNTPEVSPKNIYIILVVAIGAMGLWLLYESFTNNFNLVGLFLGLAFSAGAIIIFRQYLKEK